MPQTCTVCRHDNRADIETALVRQHPYRDIARQFGVSKDAVARHRPHLSEALMESREAEEAARVGSLRDELVAKIHDLKQSSAATKAIAARALQQEPPDFKTALNAIRAEAELARALKPYLELNGELTGELGGCQQEQPGPIRGILMPKTDGSSTFVAGKVVFSVPRLTATDPPALAPPDQPTGPRSE